MESVIINGMVGPLITANPYSDMIAKLRAVADDADGADLRALAAEIRNQIPESTNPKDRIGLEYKVIEAMVDELLKLDGLRVQYDGFAVVLGNDETGRSILGGALREGIRRALPPHIELSPKVGRENGVLKFPLQHIFRVKEY